MVLQYRQRLDSSSYGTFDSVLLCEKPVELSLIDPDYAYVNVRRVIEPGVLFPGCRILIHLYLK